MFDAVTVLTHNGDEYASQVFGCIVCNTATTGYYTPKGFVVFVYLMCPIQFWVFFRLWA